MMATIGHNNPPVHLSKREFRRLVVEELSNKTDVLIGHTIEYLMDGKGVCDVSVKEIMRCSKIKKRQTILEGLQRIADQIGMVIEKENGKQNKYLTPTKPVPLKGTGQPVPANGTGTVKSSTFKRYSPPEPVPLNGTGSRARDNNNYNNINNNKLASLSPRLEASGLNGQTSEMLKTLAGWIFLDSFEGKMCPQSGPQEPHFETAENILRSNSDAFGAQVVKEAFAEMQTDLLSKRDVRNHTKLFMAICKQVKGREGKAKKSSAIEQIRKITEGF